MEKSKVLDGLIQKHPHKFSMWLKDECGYELLLNTGYQYNELHAIAGSSIKEVLAQIKDVKACPSDCVCRTW